ncbi:bifunctional RNA recognition motif domain/Nucleotide-binding alpha-beta plait domain superfamily/RNA-binding domain superfamily [Babesia duncani]|uniref:Bifunctional RNA recognition motif domain/Nucleotide-binding alpha-beta plait domain superfamily/RNA-binding domain superfamily n=1 Tax=Babesia duncani TaxID=323732 RepID=A0AAD9UQC3_9APIC|nr:bifunctional RNA recognition motif domain/Nucleotide-binding alpha-beta plait domain superfamily/RNA-binding domain superfamily [Babesia duncani]
MAAQIPLMPPILPSLPVAGPPLKPRGVIKPQYTQKVEADPSIPPNQTIYVKNLNDRIPLRILKAELRRLFEKFGTILDIVAMNSFWRKGQAWIVYEQVEFATKALEEMQGFMLHGHAIRVNYALEQSDVVTKANGTFVPRPSGPKKPKAIIAREATQQQLFKDMQTDFVKGNFDGMRHPNEGVPQMMAQARIQQQPRAQVMDSMQIHPRGFSAPAHGLANRILFVEGLPQDVTTEEVDGIFQTISGFIESRVIPSRRVAFVDFNTEINSEFALQTLQGSEIRGHTINISFAKH